MCVERSGVPPSPAVRSPRFLSRVPSGPLVLGAALKDNPQDRRRVRHYFDTEVSGKQGAHWQQLYEQRHLLD